MVRGRCVGEGEGVVRARVRVSASQYACPSSPTPLPEHAPALPASDPTRLVPDGNMSRHLLKRQT